MLQIAFSNMGFWKWEKVTNAIICVPSFVKLLTLIMCNLIPLK